MLEIIGRMLCFILCNFCLITSTVSYLKAAKVEKKTDKYVSFIILYFFRILIFELILGFVFKWLNYYSITIFAVIELLTIILIYNKKHGNFIIDFAKEIKEFFKKIKNKKEKRKFDFNFILFMIFIVTFVFMFVISMFVYEYSFDGNYYHIPHIIDYVQTESIHMTNNTLWNNVYPQNIELLNMFFMLFSNSIFGIRLVQVIFALLGIIVTYKLMVLTGFDKKISYICGLLYFVSPFILAQMSTTYLDGIVVTLFITLLYYLVRIIKYNCTFDDFIFYITLSLFLGVKGTCAIYAGIIIFIYIIFKVYCLINKKEEIKSLLLKCIIAILIISLIGCNWLILNFFRFGNPLHPFAFLNIDGLDASIDIGVENEPKVFENKNYAEKMIISWLGLDSGFVDIETGLTLSSFVQYPDKRVGGLGVIWTFLLLPSIVLAVFLLILKKYKLNLFQFLVIFITIISFAVTPANWWGRYVGFIILLGFISVGIVYELLKNIKKHKKIIFIMLSIYILILYILAVICSSYYAVTNFVGGYYWDKDQELLKYVNTEEKKNIILLENSYHLGARYLVLLKGDKLQNSVETYYIKEMYKNASVSNHNISTYENFCKIIESKENIDAFILLDATKTRENHTFLEKYYTENKDKINKLCFGKDIIVYEKNN